MGDNLSKRSWVFFSFSFFVILLIIRSPALLLEPRFWAEEGNIYYLHALKHGFWDTIFNDYSGYSIYINYLSIFNNIASIIASWMPIKYAPFATTYSAALVHITMLWIILTGNSELYRTRTERFLTCYIFWTVGATSEIWLNTINSQFYFAVISLLLIFEKEIKTKRLVAYIFILILANFTGLVSCFLTPLFWLKLYYERSKAALLLAIPATIGSLIQFAIFMKVMLKGGIVGRFTEDALSNVRTASVFMQTLISSVFTPNTKLVSNLTKKISASPMVAMLIVLAIMIITAIFLTRAFGAQKKNYSCVNKLILAFTLYSTLSAFGMLQSEDAVGSRYLYLGSASLIYLVARESYFFCKKLNFKTYLTTFILMFSLISWTKLYFLCTYCPKKDWPKWRIEVARWEKDHNYEMVIYPPDGNWKIKYKPEDE